MVTSAATCLRMHERLCATQFRHAKIHAFSNAYPLGLDWHVAVYIVFVERMLLLFNFLHKSKA